MKNESILVVGAGMAGLSCARELQDAGRQVTVVEKSRGIGGRMSTRRTEAGQFDHGAQYFTARDEAFAAVLSQWQQSGVVARWQPRMAVFGDEEQHRDSTAVWRHVGTPAMNAALQQLAQGLHLQTQCQVVELARDGQRWRLRSEQQGWHAEAFDAVVLALPAPQAQVLVAAHSAPLERCAAGVSMLPCWALMLHFEQAPGLPFDAAFVNEGALSWLARDSSKPGRKVSGECWVAHASTAWSLAHLEASAVQVAAWLQQEFERLVATRTDAALPALQSVQAHRWLYARAEAGAGQPYALDALCQLALCGDWLPGDRVEGAWRSGRLLARALLG